MKVLILLVCVTLASGRARNSRPSQLTVANNSKDFTGKVALITGSNSGMGREIARVLSSLGAHVVITGRNATTVREAAQEVQQSSPKKLKPLQFVGDLTNDDNIKKLVNNTIKEFGRLDILVNNAGAGFMATAESPNFIKELDKSHKLLVRAPALLDQLAIPHLKKSKGNIIHISSMAASVPSPMMTPYSIAKIGVDMLTRCLALELGPHGVRVNTINPGVTDTNFQERSNLPKIVLQVSASRTPLRRFGKPIDIARGVAFLASSDAAFITGANLYIDGGFVWTAGGLFDPSTI